MICGVGVDILSMNRIRALSPNWNDPFFVKTFTGKEREQGIASEDPVRYFAGRFSGKEAVFKSFRISPESIRLSEIEIINDDEGKPNVNLFGSARQVAMEKSIGAISISLSSDNDMMIAFVISEFAC